MEPVCICCKQTVCTTAQPTKTDGPAPIFISYHQTHERVKNSRYPSKKRGANEYLHHLNLGHIGGDMPITLAWSREGSGCTTFGDVKEVFADVIAPRIFYCDIMLLSAVYAAPHSLTLAALYHDSSDLLRQVYMAARQINAKYIHFARFEPVKHAEPPNHLCVALMRNMMTQRKQEETLEQVGFLVQDIKRLFAPALRLLIGHAAAAQGVDLPRDVVDEILGWL